MKTYAHAVAGPTFHQFFLVFPAHHDKLINRLFHLLLNLDIKLNLENVEKFQNYRTHKLIRRFITIIVLLISLHFLEKINLHDLVSFLCSFNSMHRLFGALTIGNIASNKKLRKPVIMQFLRI